MSLSCDCYDAEPLEFGHAEMRVARKHYKCLECGQEIRNGEKYEHFWGKAGGDTWTSRTCAFCTRVREDLTEQGFCVYPGEMWADIEEMEAEEA